MYRWKKTDVDCKISTSLDFILFIITKIRCSKSLEIHGNLLQKQKKLYPKATYGANYSPRAWEIYKDCQK